MNSSWSRIARAILLCFVGLVMLNVSAVAQTGSPPPASQYNDEAGAKTEPLSDSVADQLSTSALAAFASVVKIANQAINSIRGNGALKAYGERLVLVLTGIVILWAILKNLALKQSLAQVVGDLVLPLIIAAFVLGAGIAKLPEVIEASVTTVAGLFGSTGANGMELAIAKNLITAAARIWNAEAPDSVSTGIGSLLGLGLASLGMLFLKIGIILLIVVAAGLGVAAILVAKFQMALAVALAPLLIPWLVFKPTEFLFSGWLNFLLKAGFGLVGIFAVASVVIAGSQGMAALIGTTAGGASAVMTYLAMGGMSIIFTYLMLKGADIGEGIISGGATGIGQLSSVAKGGAASSPGRMVGAAAGMAGSAARVAGGGAAGKMMAGRELTGAQAQLAQRAFGKGTVARAAFERTRGGKAPPSKEPQS